MGKAGYKTHGKSRSTTGAVGRRKIELMCHETDVELERANKRPVKAPSVK